MGDALTAGIIRFASFELDLRSGELFQDGSKVPLREQGFRILALLTESPGQLVTRQEIRARLWPNNTVVEFENAVNAAIKNLRIALGDSAESPRFIETVKRRGYRFLAPVERVTQDATDVSASGEEQRPTAQGWSGRKVSHYRVLDLIGGGGMGLVYRAEDIRLGRRVALKVVPDELASHPKAWERLRHEACAASALNHPNICTIYEIDEHDAQPFIVMELLEGSNLRDCIAHKPLPLAQVIDFALQIVSGLAAAHEKGLIHRDIKPANIFVTNTNHVKILDFGLARLMQSDTSLTAPHSSDNTGADLPPQHHPDFSLTGYASGTPSYMSPEQIAKDSLDARTDVYSFGLVLREMAASGQLSARTAPGTSQASTGGSLPAGRVELPSALRPIVTKATEPDRRRRYQTAAELRDDLLRVQQRIRASPLRAAVQSFFSSDNLRRRALPIAAALVLTGLAFIVIRTKRQQPPTSNGDIKATQLTTSAAEDFVENAMLSPDGNYLLFGDQINIHLRLLATGESQEFPKPKPLSSKDAWLPVAWFPDGTRFVANSQQLTPEGQVTSTWVVNIFNHESHLLREDALAQSVSPDGSRIAFTRGGLDMDGEIWTMSRSGEDVRRLVPFDENIGYGVVRWSPDSRRLLYVERHNPHLFSWSIQSRSLEGGTSVTVVEKASAETGLLWTPSGRILYTGGFDQNRNVPRGHDGNIWALDVAPDGTPRGQPRKLTNLVDFHLDRFSLSNDEKKLVAINSSTQWDVFVAQIQKNGEITTPRRLTFEDSNDAPLDWTRDSKSVIFVSDRTGIFNVFKQRIDQSVAVQMTNGPNVNIMARVSPDGKWLLYMSRQPGMVPTANLMRMPIDGGAPQLIRTFPAVTDLACPKPPATECIAGQAQTGILTAFDPLTGHTRPLFNVHATNNHRDGFASLSPDGTRFAVLHRSPRQGVFEMVSFEGKPLGELRVPGWSNLNSGDWAPDGKSIYVSSGTPLGATLLRVDLKGQAQPIWQVWGSGRAWASGRTWAIPSPDGHRLALLGQTTHSNAWLFENF